MVFYLRPAEHLPSSRTLVGGTKVHTALKANGQLYHYKRMPFGFKKSPAAFQHTIDSFIVENNYKHDLHI